ncbi:hypothetical protein [Devosia sp. Root436]|uniref:hypothetical protein n=1 Tax=Devosia sp. Root436 TaxID=1736537 RepID=UPI0012E3A2D1|nr:hypothetical protein [Devosia sp. Root436]
MIVAQRLGGRDLWLPLEVPAESALATIVGTDAALRVAAALGKPQRSSNGEIGVSVLIPGNRRCVSEDQARAALVTSDERAAERLGINESTVTQWRMHFTGKVWDR